MTFAPMLLSQLALPDGLFCESNAALTPLPGLMPLIVCPKASGKHMILDGCKRFASYKEHNNTQCVCGILTNELSELQKAIFRVLINRSRPFDLQEQYCLVQWFKKSDLPGQDLDILAACVGLDSRDLKVVQALALCGSQVREAVFEGKIHEENAMNFNALVGNDRHAFLSLSAGLQLSFQTEREFLEWLPEIAYAGKKSIADILGSDEIQKVKNDALLNAPQKIQKIRDHIHSLRFPRYDAALLHWHDVANKTFANMNRVAVVPNPYFEKSRLEVRVTVSAGINAREVFGKLAQVTESTWASLIDPLK